MAERDRTEGDSPRSERPAVAMPDFNRIDLFRARIHRVTDSDNSLELIEKAQNGVEVDGHDETYVEMSRDFLEMMRDIRSSGSEGHSEADYVLSPLAQEVLSGHLTDRLLASDAPIILVLLRNTEGKTLRTREHIIDAWRAIESVITRESEFTEGVRRQLEVKAREAGITHDELRGAGLPVETVSRRDEGRVSGRNPDESLPRSRDEGGAEDESSDRPSESRPDRPSESRPVRPPERRRENDLRRRTVAVHTSLAHMADRMREFEIKADDALGIEPTEGFTSLVRRRTEEKYGRKNRDGTISIAEEIVQKEIEGAVLERRWKLSQAYRDILSNATGNKLFSRESFNGVVRELREEGFLSDDEAGRWEDLVDRFENDEVLNGMATAVEARGPGIGSPTTPEEYFKDAATMGIAFSEDEKQLIRALLNDDDPDSIATLYAGRLALTTPAGDHARAWKKFESDITGIFETILSATDANPQQADSLGNYYEQQLFNILATRLSAFGLRSGGLRNPIIPMDELESIAGDDQFTPEGHIIGPQDKALKRTKRMRSLEDAIGTVLHQKMINLRDRYRIFNQMNMALEQGGGLETMGQYVGRLNTIGLDQMFYDDPYLSYAIELYLESLKTEIARSEHAVLPDFGMQDSSGLDAVQRRAYEKLLERYHADKINDARREGRLPDPLTESDKRKIKRKIRIATAIAQGVSSEFWGIVLGAQMLVTTDRDPVTGRSKIKHIFAGSHSKGLEKIIFDLNPIALWERIGGMPGFNETIRYVYRPRDIEKAKHALRERYSHRKVYRVRRMIENAHSNGRSDECADFDLENITLAEETIPTFIDVLQRGGWRFRYEKAFWEDSASRSCTNLHRVAPYLVKRYIDSHLGSDTSFGMEYITGVARVDPEMAARMRGAYQRMMDMYTKDNIRAYKTLLYEHEIYGRMRRQESTQFVISERRRFMPAHEIARGEGLRDGLNMFLLNHPLFRGMERGYVHAHVTDMLLSGVQLAQSMRMDQAKLEHQRSIDTGRRDDGIMDYTFSERDFNNEDIHNALARMIRSRIHDGRIKIPSLDGIDEDTAVSRLVETTVGYYTELERLIDLPRTTRENPRNSYYMAETLQHRHADFLAREMAYALNDLEGTRFDRNAFMLASGGARTMGRMIDEASSMKKIGEAFRKLFFTTLVNAVQKGNGKGGNIEGIAEEIAGAVNEVIEPIAAVDDNIADKRTMSLMIYIDRLIGKDRIFRPMIFGAALEDVNSRYLKRASSLYQDFYVNRLERPTRSFDSSDLGKIWDKIAEKTGLRWESHLPVDDLTGDDREDRRRAAETRAKRSEEARRVAIAERAEDYARRAEEARRLGGFVNELKAQFFEIQSRNFSRGIVEAESLLRRTFGRIPRIGSYLSSGLTRMGERKSSYEMIRSIVGTDSFTRIAENIPVVIIISLALIIALFLAAKDKNKKASGGGS